MTEYQRNSYDDDDMRDVIAEIEKLEAQKVSIMAKAAGECGGIANKIKVLKKQAKDDLGIPLKVLTPLLKRRKLERKIEELDADVPEDFVEVYEDACGQFSFLQTREHDDEEAEEGSDDTPSTTVDPTAAEQAEGAAVLSKVVKH